jgi:hypothetical protein
LGESFQGMPPRPLAGVPADEGSERSPLDLISPEVAASGGGVTTWLAEGELGAGAGNSVRAVPTGSGVFSESTGSGAGAGAIAATTGAGATTGTGLASSFPHPRQNL